jgi:hypothetical protein
VDRGNEKGGGAMDSKQWVVKEGGQ